MLPLMKPMVVFLERTLKPQSGRTKPRYLNESAAELPDTLLIGVKKETLNLYDYAFDIICEGLRLDPKKIVSQQSLKEIAGPLSLKTSINIDERYEREVKSLYAEIIAVSSRSQAQLSTAQTEQLYDHRNAGMDLIEAIKATKHLQKNLERFHDSDHPVIHELYYKIRLRLARVLREMNHIRLEHEEGDESITSVSLDALAEEVRKTSKRRDTRLDKLIRDDVVTATLATSLMNDYTYAARVSQELLAAANALFASHDPGSRYAERSILLEVDEVSDALNEHPTEPKP